MTGEQPDHQAKEYFEAGLTPLSLEQPLPLFHRARDNWYFHQLFEHSAAVFLAESTSRKGSIHMRALQRTTT